MSDYIEENVHEGAAQTKADPPPAYRPRVALAGRPNVGKSTLFNRLLRRRRSITDPTPGVTRDPVSMGAVILGRPVELIDTGGFKLDREHDSIQGDLEREVVERTLGILKGADLIVLIFEAGELTLEDEEFISLLRPYQSKLLAVVNKTEGGRRISESYNILSYGFDRVIMISAEHGDNVGELEEAIIAALPESGPEGPGAEGRGAGGTQTQGSIKLALLGKPNTGKSTLSNRLTSSEASIVSPHPGTTRDVVEGEFTFKKRKFQVLDTAGIRRKTKVSENIEYYSVNRAIRAIDQADIVILIIDAQESLTDQDKKIAALAHEKGRGIILALNKWDTMGEGKNTFNAVRDRIRFLFGQMEYAPILPLSALNGEGLEKLLNTCITMSAQLHRQIETSVLNQHLSKWLVEYPPPLGKQSRFKVRYAVQTQANPVRFIFFASRSHAVSEPYVAYLRNRIRRDLGFSLIPLLIEVRASSTREKGR
ncbi:MAG: ribosome biogenesis GTPase Der [Treponema sp.]|nr:ribosome biogenesis GTPase Der [Treponema sp.]